MPSVRLRGVSRLYATEPVGVVEQPEFRNAVVALDVPRGPNPATGALALLIALKQIERAFGRQDRERWGPRELDLDLLVFGRHRIAVERPPDARSADPAKPTDLVVPHRLAGERLFVLAPLADLALRLVPPGWHETVESARRRRVSIEGSDAVRPIARSSCLRAISRASAPVAGSGPRGTSRATTALRNSGCSTTPTGSVA
jgi:2-amino-4-hydroxy-6-hydroxymethyldihydropteridine diphosphokinase